MTRLGRKTNPYAKTMWYDRIVDVTTGQVIQDGTRFNQSRANNIEDGIYGAYDYIIGLESTVKRLQAQLDIDGRVPGNGGSFFDTFDGTSTRLVRLDEMTDVTDAVSDGSSVTIPVASSKGFISLSYATIYDATNYEHVYITAVDEGFITVQSLVGDYAKGAKIARSNASIDLIEQSMGVAPHVTYDVELTEVI